MADGGPELQAVFQFVGTRLPIEPLVKHGYWREEDDRLDVHEIGMPYTSLRDSYQTRTIDRYDGTHMRW